MKLLRNHDVKRSLLLYILLTVFFTVAAAFFNVYFSAYIFVVCIAFTLINIFITYRRYKKISSFSQELDKILMEMNTHRGRASTLQMKVEVIYTKGAGGKFNNDVTLNRCYCGYIPSD